MLVTVAVLIVLVQLFQMVGDQIARNADKK
jgi:ABC-type methionine transport system permease subunit